MLLASANVKNFIRRAIGLNRWPHVIENAMLLNQIRNFKVTIKLAPRKRNTLALMLTISFILSPLRHKRKNMIA